MDTTQLSSTETVSKCCHLSQLFQVVICLFLHWRLLEEMGRWMRACSFGGFSLPSYLLPLYQSTLKKARGGLLGELLLGAPSLCDGHY